MNDLIKLRKDCKSPTQLMILDGIAETQFGRDCLRGHVPKLDAQSLAYVARQLEYVYAKAYEEEFPELRMAAGDIIPIDRSVPDGAKTFIYYLYTGSGIAKFASGYGTELSIVSVQGASVVGQVAEMENGYAYTRKDLRAAGMAGDNLDGRLSTHARRAHEELLNDTGMWGREDLGLPGFANHPNMNVVKSPANGTASSRHWADKDNDLILEDISTLIDTTNELTFGKRTVNRVEFTREITRLLKRRRLTDGSGDGYVTLWKFIQENHEGVTFGILNELSASLSKGNLTEDAALAFVGGNADLVSLVVPMDFTQNSPQESGNTIMIPCESSTGGVKMPEPLIVTRMDNVGPAT